MSAPVNPSAAIYTQGFGTASLSALGIIPITSPSSPGPSNIQGLSGPLKLGQMWINTITSAIYILGDLSPSNGMITANWEQITGGGGGGSVLSVGGTLNQVSVSPTTGNVVVGLTNGISLGAYEATPPPVGGLLIPGRVGIGSNAPNISALLNVTNTLPYSLNIDGTTNSADPSGTNISICIQPDVKPTDNNVHCYSVASFTNFGAQVGQIIPIAANFYGEHTSDFNEGIINLSAVFYADSGRSFVGGYASAYGAYFLDQDAGSVPHMAMYAENASIGDPTTVPPAQGLLVAGKVGVGTSSISAPALMELVSVTQGFLPPRMSTVQKDAIATPVAGLVVYDNTLNQLSYYNGTAWVDL